ncbi:hypothetical protein PG995_011732 [Apiospora arundinis]
MPLAREPSQRSKWMRWHNNNNAANAAANINSKNEPSEIIHLGGSRVSSAHHQLHAEPAAAQPGRGAQGQAAGPCADPLFPPEAAVPLAYGCFVEFQRRGSRSAFSPPLTGSSNNSRGSAAMFSPVAPNPFACNPVSPSSSVSSYESPDEPSSSSSALRRSQSVADIKDRSKDRSRSNTGGSKQRWRPFPNSTTPSESDGEMDEVYSRQPASSRAESGSSSRTYPPPTHPPPSGPLPAISQVLSMGDQQQQQEQLQQHQRQQSSSAPLPPPPSSSSSQNLAPSQQPPPRDQSSTANPVSSLTRSSSLNSPKISLVVPSKSSSQPAKTTRFTREERLWLHRNYRGEANFLRAWGLSIDSEEDRDEGAALLRELVQSEQEAKWIKSQQQQQTVAERAEQITITAVNKNNSNNGNNSNNDGLSPLQVIVEESNTGHSPRQLPPYGYKYPGVMVEETPLTPMGPGGGADTNEDGVNLRIPVGNAKASWSQQQHLARVAAAKEHARSESEHSVLGAYLDVRMSRLD